MKWNARGSRLDGVFKMTCVDPSGQHRIWKTIPRVLYLCLSSRPVGRHLSKYSRTFPVPKVLRCKARSGRVSVPWPTGSHAPNIVHSPGPMSRTGGRGTDQSPDISMGCRGFSMFCYVCSLLCFPNICNSDLSVNAGYCASSNHTHLRSLPASNACLLPVACVADWVRATVNDFIVLWVPACACPCAAVLRQEQRSPGHTCPPCPDQQPIMAFQSTPYDPK